MSATEIEQPSAGPYISFSNTNPAEGHKVQEHKFVEELPVEPKVESVDAAPEPEQQAPEVREPRVQEVETKEPERSLAFSSEPLPAPPVFEDKHKEREYLKQRLTLAFRVFAKLGFDCGIAGHITLRVWSPHFVLCSCTDKGIGPCGPDFFLAKSIWSSMASFGVERPH